MPYRAWPCRIVKSRKFKADFRRPGVIALEELGLVSRPSQRRISRVASRAERFVALEDALSVGIDLKPQSMPVVAGNPYAVDEPLVIGVHGERVFAGCSGQGPQPVKTLEPRRFS